MKTFEIRLEEYMQHFKILSANDFQYLKDKDYNRLSLLDCKLEYIFRLISFYIDNHTNIFPATLWLKLDTPYYADIGRKYKYEHEENQKHKAIADRNTLLLQLFCRYDLCNNITRLDLSDLSINDQVFLQILRLPNIKKLITGRILIDTTKAILLSNYVTNQRRSKLESLDISNCETNSQAVEYLMGTKLKLYNLYKLSHELSVEMNERIISEGEIYPERVADDPEFMSDEDESVEG